MGDGRVRLVERPALFADPAGRALVLDRRVAAALGREESWDLPAHGWSDGQYDRWLRHAHGLAARHAVSVDTVEAAYFLAGTPAIRKNATR